MTLAPSAGVGQPSTGRPTAQLGRLSHSRPARAAAARGSAIKVPRRPPPTRAAANETAPSGSGSGGGVGEEPASAPAPTAPAPTAAATRGRAAASRPLPLVGVPGRPLPAPSARGPGAGSTAPPPPSALATLARRQPPAPAPARPPPTPATPPPAPVDPWAESRAEATAEVEGHDPQEVAAGRQFWLYFTVPATPTAGAPARIYFNRAQSDALRWEDGLELDIASNAWSLPVTTAEGGGEGGGEGGLAPPGAPIPLTPSPIARSDGVDFYGATFRVPEHAYELNFAVRAGPGGPREDGGGRNFLIPVRGPTDADGWADLAAAEVAARAAAEAADLRAAADAAKAEREAEALEDETEAARQVAGGVLYHYDEWREGCSADGADPRGAWRAEPRRVYPGSSFKLVYDLRGGDQALVAAADGPAGPPTADDPPSVRWGFNGWQGVQDTRLAPESSDGRLWSARLEVPLTAVSLQFVFSLRGEFDNNRGADHGMAVALPPGMPTKEAWARGLEALLREQLAAQRRERDAAAEARARARAALRAAQLHEMKEVRRRQRHHVLFTRPAEPVAGRVVEICYNPSNTLLAGSSEVWVRGGFNRWTHRCAFPPTRMLRSSAGTGGGGEGAGAGADSAAGPAPRHLTAEVRVPVDAYSLDFVFSNVEEGEGLYDNRGGLDYSLPVSRGTRAEPPLHVVHVAVEMAPIAKVGGLGDVVTALGRAVQDLGHRVEVLLPRYDFFLSSPLLQGGAMAYETEFDWCGVRVFVSSAIVEGLRVFLIEPRNGMFSGQTVYTGPGDTARFEFFCEAALEFLIRTGRDPDILHCHDWSTADVAPLFWERYRSYGLANPRVIFTIHNLDFGQAKIGAAAHHSQRFTTVSPTYASEIAGHPAIAPHVGKLSGILNGIDPDIWDPERDPFLPVGYSEATVAEGKRSARRALSDRLGLEFRPDRPLVGVVTRLTEQKGTHLIAHAAWRALDRGGQFVLLGSAPDPRVQAGFDSLAARTAGPSAAFFFAYDEPLSHLVYAASDFILVPSIFEPCGLTQLIAMRYGSVPIVRHTGGLRDTVFDVDVDADRRRAAWELGGETYPDSRVDGGGAAGGPDREPVDRTNGYAFEGTDAGSFDYALNRAIDTFYSDHAAFHRLRRRVMSQDWSWNKPALEYIDLYHAARK